MIPSEKMLAYSSSDITDAIDSAGVFLNTLTQDIPFGGSTASALVDYIGNLSHDVLVTIWPAVQAVAEELLKKKTLKYTQVRALIKNSIGVMPKIDIL